MVFVSQGEIQFASMSPDSPFVIALGGEDSDSNFRILNLLDISDGEWKSERDRESNQS